MQTPRQQTIGRAIGSYELIELLGSGGMGQVWRARHHLLGRDAAIKLRRPDQLGAESEAAVRARFEAEARATAVLASPHTIRIFDFGSTGEGDLYYVMELLCGCDLETLVRRFGPLSSDRVLCLVEQACHSLGEAHSRGLVHGDIKPANLFACRMALEYDFVKVFDFGLAWPERRGFTETLLMGKHVTAGTPAYMAPEVILGSHNVDRRADVYALGCVLYFLLTGRLVFEAGTAMDMLLAHLEREPRPPSAVTECPIPSAVDSLVIACLQKDPSQRPGGVEEVRRCVAALNRGTWTQCAAKSWWNLHLPEFDRELSIESHGSWRCPSPDVATRAPSYDGLTGVCR